MAAAKKIGESNEFIPFVSNMIEKITGVQLGVKQEVMVRSRILKRALELNLSTVEAYADYFYEHQEEERKELISLLTTHHTFFFREFQQFEILQREVLAKILPEVRKRADKKIQVWSAACSRGQEVYSLAMFLDVVLKQMAPDIGFEILGTDVDEQSVQMGSNGVYHATEIKEAPLLYIGNHWTKGTGDIADYVKVKSALRQHCQFQTLNLTDPANKFPQKKFDLIFCRNVFIYFTQTQIQEIVAKFILNMHPHSHLFVGVSESLNGYDIKMESAGGSVYRLPQKKAVTPAAVGVAVGAEKKATVQKNIDNVLPMPERPLRVFSIDDSPTIHSILKQILGKAGGFEWVGSAINGKDAAEKLKTIKPDVITLDIHMPEMNGIEYLKTHYKAGHPPVVMISSVSREDSDLAFQALKHGAADYVEKPALANMQERGEEICLKLRTAVEARRLGVKSSLQVDKSFAKKTKPKDAKNSAVVVLGSFSHDPLFSAFVKEWSKEGPPVYFMVEGAKSGLEAFAKKLSESSGAKISVWAPGSQAISPGEFAVCDLQESFTAIRDKKFKLAICAHNGLTKKAAELVLTAAGAQLFIEEGKNKNSLADAATDSAPATSFPYFSWKALSE